MKILIGEFREITGKKFLIKLFRFRKIQHLTRGYLIEVNE
jgi:hypothetical protein